ncbi:quinone oxidoreductase family protein [Chitinophaga sp. RAB17]|uniref:quinone oxidoreductase family protein n=1 Tax=Chitinophaga sp. RAB17 TaxID=3233049 RepID=UPI003F927BB5
MKQLSVINAEIWEQWMENDERCRILMGDTDLYFGLVDVDDIYSGPEPGENEVLVRKLAFSSNYRDRTLVIQAGRALEGKQQQFPFGSDFVARVLAVGSQVRGLSVGDRVMANGTMEDTGKCSRGLPTNWASKIFELIPAGKLIQVPDAMPDEVAAAFTIAAQTSYSMVNKARIKRGDRVLVTAGGSNTSLAILSILRNRTDIQVIVTTTSAATAEALTAEFEAKVLSVDADKQLHTNESFLALSGTEGFDVVFDPLMDVHFPSLYNRLNYFGRYITCGILTQHSTMMKEHLYTDDPGFTLQQVLMYFMSRSISFIGNCLGTTADLEEAMRDYLAGKFSIKISDIFNTTAAQSFVDRTFVDRTNLGKVIFKY